MTAADAADLELQNHLHDCLLCLGGEKCDEALELFNAALAALVATDEPEPLRITPISTHLDSLTTQGVTDDC